MRKTLLILFILFLSVLTYAGGFDTSNLVIPPGRLYFHDKVDKQQKAIDKLDGKRDNMVNISSNEDFNLQITDAFTRKIDNLQREIELDTTLKSNNDKVRYLSYLEKLLLDFTLRFRTGKFPASMSPQLVSYFQQLMEANIKGQSITPLVDQMPYETGVILSDIFFDNTGYAAAKKLLYLKNTVPHPETIITGLWPYRNDADADSLIQQACLRVPFDIMRYAQAPGSQEASMIRKSTDPKVRMLVKMASLKSGQRLFPFFDELINGRLNIEDMAAVLEDEVKYYKLLVKTKMSYTERMLKNEEPVFYSYLEDMLEKKAKETFVNVMNELHEKPEAVRFRCIEPLNPQELYYTLVVSDDIIYTSTFINTYKRMMDRLAVRRGDSLLMSVRLDHFKKFIKMAASYDQLDNFLSSMDSASGRMLMNAFVSNLEKNNTLEDAADVADSYGGITNESIKYLMLDRIQKSLERARKEKNQRGSVIYSIIQTIFKSASDTTVDISDKLGIPPVYSVTNSSLSDSAGRIIMQVFFYGDDDGKNFFPKYLNLFSNKTEWSITGNEEWVTIKSIKSKPLWIYVNRPLDNDTYKDSAAQAHLANYLRYNNLKPTVIVHRGHSYWVKYTIDQLPSSGKIIVLGSCGGFKNMADVLKHCEDAHIISSKEIGAGAVNDVILRTLTDNMRAGKNVEWLSMWKSLAAQFPGGESKERFSNYVPPHKNLGAIFLKAYKKAMGEGN
ncbi:MAG: hypothetical protein HYX40_11795 [Sphingobacteriales bacterium]|nr:hypothetical protein [Sphingobacteriales bacterium]